MAFNLSMIPRVKVKELNVNKFGMKDLKKMKYLFVQMLEDQFDLYFTYIIMN